MQSKNLSGIPLGERDWLKVFCSRFGDTDLFYIFIYRLIDKLKRFLDVELAAQPICSMIHMIAKTCVIDLYPASTVTKRNPTCFHHPPPLEF